jgi:hypothetical protein
MSSIITSIKILSLLIPCFLATTIYSFAQDNSLEEYAAGNVKSVFFEKDGWRLAYPFVQINSPEQIVLHFDILYGHGESLWYRLEHCDRDWNSSELFTSDFLEGFEENQISDYIPSFNTRPGYTHYSLRLPNEDAQFKISGNYIITVWAPGEPDKPLLKKRFFVTEGTTSAGVMFRRPMKPGTTETHQQPEITVLIDKLLVTDPYSQVTITVMQNGRWDKTRSSLKPDFVGNNKLEFNALSDNTLFPGRNEFRYFDIKTIRQTRQNVRAIEFLEGLYHAFLLPSDDREFKQYFFNEDINGKYIIAMEESNTPDSDADYVWVYFTLPLYQELQGGSVYITGALTDWSYGPENRMTWNASRGCYEGSLLLKQGWYNYEYAFLPSGLQVPEGAHFEGDHYETENDYLILTYFRDPRERYDRLTGVTVANTRGPR